MKDREQEIGNKDVYFYPTTEKYKVELWIADFTQHKGQPIVFQGVDEIERLRYFLNSLDLD